MSPVGNDSPLHKHMKEKCVSEWKEKFSVRFLHVLKDFKVVSFYETIIHPLLVTVYGFVFTCAFTVKNKASN